MLLSIFDLAVGTDPITQWIKTSIDKWISGAQVLHLDPVSSLTGHTDPQLHKKYSLIPNFPQSSQHRELTHGHVQ